MKSQRNAYPLRMEPGVRPEVEKLAKIQERSLNWQLNELLKIGLANFAAKIEKPQPSREA